MSGVLIDVRLVFSHALNNKVADGSRNWRLNIGEILWMQSVKYFLVKHDVKNSLSSFKLLERGVKSGFDCGVKWIVLW